MKRSIEKAVTDYRKKYYKNENREGLFYASDICQVKELAEKEAQPYGGHIMGVLYNAIGIALEAGYMIGYRTAKRHARRQPPIKKSN